MGTNYFAMVDVCGCCGRPRAELHICKSLRIFRGYRHVDFEVHHTPELGDELLSWEQWKGALRAPSVQVRDEYGRDVDTERFIADVEAVPVERRRHHYDVMMSEYPEHGGDEWLDADGFSFCGREFS